MDLAELKFVVITDDLEKASKEVAKLSAEVSKLNKPVSKAAMDTEKLAKAQAEVAEKAAKAALAQLKLTEAQERSSSTSKGSVSVLERQNLILEYMSKGLSKGQSSYVATALAAGALDAEITELITTLKDQRSLMGGDPFDKSIGLMQKLNNETKTATEVNNLFNKGLNLSEKQMTDLAREKERLNTLYRLEGKSLDDLATEYDQIVQKSVAINQANDARTNSMKAQVKAQDDAAKANIYIANEMERVNRLTESNGSLTSATNNKIINFEKSLRASGRTAAEVSIQLEAYKQKLLSTQKAAGNRQIDYLSRALGPQITDIAVGLATGQAPLTILLQQGGQLRDQFALAGVAGADMGKMLIQASKSMVSSVKDVGMAVGQVFVGAITGTGKAVTNFGMQITGTSFLLDIFRNKIIEVNGANGTMIRLFNVLGPIITGVVGVAVFSAAAAFIALGVAMSDVIKEENALNRALNLTGAALGLSLDMAYDAARGMNELGVSTGTTLTVLTEMAKLGGMSSDSLQMIATTAQKLKTAFDIPIADTVKQFKELQEKPTESLTKLAIKLGTIPVEILKQVDAYERAGKSLEAAKLATDTYAKAGKDAADRTVENFGTITRLGISLGKIWDKAWESILNIGRKDTKEEQIGKLSERLATLLAAQDLRQIENRKPRVAETIAEIKAIALQINAEKELEDQRKKASEEASAFEDQKKTRDEAGKKAKSDANKAEQDFANALETANKFYQTQIGAVDNLTKSEIALNKVKEDDVYKKFTPEQKEQIDNIYEQAKANELLVQSEKDTRDALELKNKLLGKSENLGAEYYKTIDLINKYAKEGRFGADEVLQLKAALEATTPEARRLAAVQAENAKIMAEIASERAGVSEQYGGDFKTADEKTAIKSLSDYRKKTAQADAEYQKQLAAATEETTFAEWMMYKDQADAKKVLAKEVYDREQYLLTDSFKRNQAYATAFEDLFKGMGDALIDFALTGKSSFGDMVESMIMNLIKLEMQMQMTSLLKGMGGGSGIVSAIASAFGGGGATTMSQFDYASLSGFAKGGAFTNGIVSSPSVFNMGLMGEAGPEAIMPLRRGADGSLGVAAFGGDDNTKMNQFDYASMTGFAKGGAFTNGIVNSPTMFNTSVMGEAGPEAIMPLRRGADGSLGVASSGGSGGNVSVQVINNSSSQATTNETTDSKGNRKIEVVIGDMNAGEISRNGSASQKSIKSTFGIQPQLIRR